MSKCRFVDICRCRHIPCIPLPSHPYSHLLNYLMKAAGKVHLSNQVFCTDLKYEYLEELKTQIVTEIDAYFEKHFGKWFRKNSHFLEADYATRREYEVTRATLERQVSQTNAIFMIADKSERYCRDMEREFQDLREKFNCKADLQAVIDVEAELK